MKPEPEARIHDTLNFFCRSAFGDSKSTSEEQKLDCKFSEFCSEMSWKFSEISENFQKFLKFQKSEIFQKRVPSHPIEGRWE
jgi:hypothetical protein